MNYKNILAVTLLVLVVGVFSLLQQKPWKASGSVMPGGEYIATTTEVSLNSYKMCMPVVASTTAGSTFGSVIVTLGSSAPLYFYDATTTGPHSDHPTTTLAAFVTTATAGTYTFDVRVKRGICAVAGESTVGVASTTFTFR